MERKKLLIGAIILILICSVLAVCIVVMTNSGESGKEKTYSLTGTWTEDSTQVEIVFKDSGVLQILGNDAAKYTLEKKEINSGTVIFEYSEAYGGQKTTLTYQVGESKLTLTNDSTGEVQTYTRKS